MAMSAYNSVCGAGADDCRAHRSNKTDAALAGVDLYGSVGGGRLEGAVVAGIGAL